MMIAITPFSAAAYDIQLFVPPGSPLAVTTADYHAPIAHFRGQVWISGTLIGEWGADEDEEGKEVLDYWLVPNESSLARLPYFGAYHVRTVDIPNGAEALRAAAGNAKLSLLVKRRTRRLEVTGTFLLRNYVVGVECDAPFASASIVKSHGPIELAAVRTSERGGC
jgi:hypothetical protein